MTNQKVVRKSFNHTKIFVASFQPVGLHLTVELILSCFRVLRLKSLFLVVALISFEWLLSELLLLALNSYWLLIISECL